jgi:hypothetical protein
MMFALHRVACISFPVLDVTNTSTLFASLARNHFFLHGCTSCWHTSDFLQKLLDGTGAERRTCT